MRLIRYQPEHQKLMLALHRSAVEEFTLGMSQQQDEADLVAIDEVYLHSRGEFLLGFMARDLSRWAASSGSRTLWLSCAG